MHTDTNSEDNKYIEPTSENKELKKLSDHLYSLLEFFPSPTALIDENQKFIAVSPSLATLFEYTAEELIGKHFSVLLAQEVIGKIPEFLRLENRFKGINIELFAKKKSGTVFTVKIKTKIGNFENRNYRWVIIEEILTDVTEVSDFDWKNDLKGMSEMINMMDEPEMVVEVAANGEIIWANNECLTRTGYSRDDLKQGLNVFDIIIPEDKERLVNSVNILLETNNPDVDEFTIVKKDGTFMPVMVSAKIIGQDSKKIRVVAFDLSEHKTIENNLLIMEKLKSLGEMAGGVVHDFNNILSIILGYIQMIPADCPNAFCRGMIENINKAALDGVEMVKRIHNFSGAGTEKSDFKKVNVNDIVTETISLLSNKITSYGNEHNIQIEIVKELVECEEILASESEMREVLSNLILNARDSISSDGSITIKTSQKKKDVLLQVIDTGSGMNEETKAKIFEPFFTTKGSKGTGLGMSVSYAIINKIGGEIYVESEPGKGTTITLILPSFESSAFQQVEDQISESLEYGQDTDASGAVLIVDDEENIREIMKEFLNLEGYKVVCSGDGESAWELFKTHSFKAVLTDYNLPGLSGWKLASMIKQEKPEIPVFILSGLVSKLEEMNKIEKIADKILQKPINFISLSNILKEFCKDCQNT